jgi:hypothetical protein
MTLQHIGVIHSQQKASNSKTRWSSLSIEKQVILTADVG